MLQNGRGTIMWYEILDSYTGKTYSQGRFGEKADAFFNLPDVKKVIRQLCDIQYGHIHNHNGTRACLSTWQFCRSVAKRLKIVCYEYKNLKLEKGIINCRLQKAKLSFTKVNKDFITEDSKSYTYCGHGSKDLFILGNFQGNYYAIQLYTDKKVESYNSKDGIPVVGYFVAKESQTEFAKTVIDNLLINLRTKEIIKATV